MTARSSRPSNARWLAAPALAAVVALAAACTKSESGTASPAATESATVTPPPAESAAAAPAVSATPTPADTPTTAAKDAADAGRAASNDAKKSDAGPASTASAAASGSAGPAECGTKPLPDCPLQAWMKANANPPVMTSDLPALAAALDKIVGFAPAGYTNWASIAKDGAAAARSGDLAAAKASCRTCHDQYKQKYKTEIRARKI